MKYKGYDIYNSNLTIKMKKRFLFFEWTVEFIYLGEYQHLYDNPYPIFYEYPSFRRVNVYSDFSAITLAAILLKLKREGVYK